MYIEYIMTNMILSISFCQASKFLMFSPFRWGRSLCFSFRFPNSPKPEMAMAIDFFGSRIPPNPMILSS